MDVTVSVTLDIITIEHTTKKVTKRLIVMLKSQPEPLAFFVYGYWRYRVYIGSYAPR